MKRILLSLLLLCSTAFSINAQDLLVPTYIEATGSQSTSELVGHAEVINNTSETISLVWERIDQTYSLGDGVWRSLICDEILCYGPNTSSNPATLEVEPGMSTKLDVHIQPIGSATLGQYGSATVTMLVYVEGNQANTAQEIEYHFSTEAVGINTTPAAVQEEIKIYPNPTRNNLQVEFNNNEVFSLGVYSIIGRKIAEYQVNSFDNDFIIPVSDFQSGLYLLNFYDANSRLIDSKSFSKIH